MPKSAKTQQLIALIGQIMEQIGERMTVRQAYYQLVARQAIENSLKSYKRFDALLTKARKDGSIDPYSFLDTSKPFLKQPSWNNLNDYIPSVKASYKRSVWPTQPEYVEFWLEKDALRGIIEPIAQKYDCCLVIGRGYQSITNILDARDRFDNDRNNYILYLGDFDPTGQDIPRSIEDNLTKFGANNFQLERIALTPEQIETYGLPPAPAKSKDSRTAGFVKKYGNKTVELDALTPQTLRHLTEKAILEHLDVEAYLHTLKLEEADKSKVDQLQGFGKEEVL